MKRYLIVVMVALLAGCAEHQVVDGSSVEISTLVDRARWGDGEAFLQLADCYRDGVGVESDFLSMFFMVMQAKQHGAIETEMDYLQRIPEDNDLKELFNMMKLNGIEFAQRRDTIVAQLSGMSHPDALAVYGVVCMEYGDSVSGSDCGTGTYELQGKVCLEHDEQGYVDEKQAAVYFLKAEEHTLLFKRDAQWLLDYHKKGGEGLLSDEEVKRLERFVLETE